MSVIKSCIFFFVIIQIQVCIQFSNLSAQNIADSLLENIEMARGNDSLLYKNYAQLVVNSIFYDLNGAQSLLDSQFFYANALNSPYYLSTTHAYAGIYNRFIGNYEKAVEQSEISLNILKQVNNDVALSMNLFNLGVVTDYQGQYEKSINYFLQYLQLNEKNQNWTNVGQAYNSISILYNELGDTEQSLTHLYKSLDIFQKHGSENQIGLAMGNIAGRYMDLEQWDSTIYYGHKTLEIGEKLKLDRTIAYASQVLAECHLRKEEYQVALPFAERALVLYNNYPDKQLSFYNYITLSTIQRNLGQDNNAHENLLIAEQIADTLNFIDGQKTVYNYLSQYYEKIGDYRKAFEAHKKFKASQDSIVNENNTQIVNDLNIQYETVKKDSEIKSQELEITKKTNQRNLLVFGFIFLALFSIFLLSRYKLRQRLSEEKIANLRQQQKLTAMDHMIQGQEEERKRVAKDLHDGLGGILATAQLQLQHLQKEAKDANKHLTHTAVKLIDSAYIEVRRIAHAMMPNALVNLGFVAAVQDLADQINVANDLVVQTHIRVDDMILPKKSQLIIYRIIQEILNNILKHAQAKNAVIQLTETNSIYHLTIEDDGKGFDKAVLNQKNGLGLKSIESRIEYLNGEMNLSSELNEGTSFDIHIPKQ